MQRESAATALAPRLCMFPLVRCIVCVFASCLVLSSARVRLTDAHACVDPVQAPGASSAGVEAGDGGDLLFRGAAQLCKLPTVWCIVCECKRVYLSLAGSFFSCLCGFIT